MFTNDTVLDKLHWYHNDELEECKLFTKSTVPSEWIKGKKKYKTKFINSEDNTLGSLYKEFSKDNIIYYTSHNLGIYHIHNKVNSKSYIGQAKKLRTRLLAHLNKYLNGNRNYPIYKAFDKYGLESFEFTILEQYDTNDPDLQKKLDDAETKYIKEYNSFGATGYNQTYGGDAGITGYRMTEDQKKHISENSQKLAADGRYKIYVYNLNTKTYEEYLTKHELNNKYNTNIHSSSYRNLIINSFLVIARTKEKLDEKLNKINNPNNTIHYNIPEDFYSYYQTHTKYEICEKYNISEKTIYNWLNKLGIQQSKQTIYKEIPEDFVEYYQNHTNKEICEKYNLRSDDTIYRWIKQLGLKKKSEM